MYKFAAVSMASIGLFLTGLVTGAAISASLHMSGTGIQSDEEDANDLDRAYEDVMNIVNQK